jgi:hypothetical protein
MLAQPESAACIRTFVLISDARAAGVHVVL